MSQSDGRGDVEGALPPARGPCPALSLVINAIIVWTTEYLAAAAEELAQHERPVPATLWPHLTPLHWERINLVGQYTFEEPIIAGRLRPLRRTTALHADARDA